MNGNDLALRYKNSRIHKQFADNDETFTVIKNTYHRKVIDAYNRLLVELMEMFFNQKPSDNTEETSLIEVSIESKSTRLSLSGAPVKGLNEKADRKWKDLQHQFCVATGRCGALCAAAKKAAQGDIIITELRSRAEIYDLDITPRVAQITAEHILGTRSLSKEKLSVFATKGRTTLDRSPLIQDSQPLLNHIEEIRAMINNFNDHCEQARRFYVIQWLIVWTKQAKQAKPGQN